jgi:hypothetical protein
MSMYTFVHNSLNVLVEIANKVGFKKKTIFNYKKGTDTNETVRITEIIFLDLGLFFLIH